MSNAGVPRMDGDLIRWEKEGNEICRDDREGERGATAADCNGGLAAGTWLSFVPQPPPAAAAMGFLEEPVEVVIGPCIVLKSHVLSWLEWLYVLASLVVGVPAWFMSSAVAAAALWPGVSFGIGVVGLQNKNKIQ